MKGTVERETRARALAAKATRAVISGLTERHTQEPFPAMSDHYRVPGAIGSVLLPHEYEQPQLPIGDWGLEWPCEDD